MDQGALGDLYHRSVTIAYTYLVHCFVNEITSTCVCSYWMWCRDGHVLRFNGFGLGMGEIQYIVKIFRFGVGEGDMK